MAGRAKGNAREAAQANRLDEAGYGVIQLKSSGARGKAMRRRKHSIVGDLLALPLSAEYRFWLQVSVGTHSPGEAFAELREHPLPGFRPLCILYRKRAKKQGGIAKVATARYYVEVDESYRTLLEALEALAQSEPPVVGAATWCDRLPAAS